MSKKILVVDDEKDYRELIRDTLLRAGFKVVTATNGEEGMETLRNEAPDLVVLDITMPVMNGYEVCKEIRKDVIYKNMPVIFLSVLKEKGNVLKGLNLGSDEYVTKPFRPKELVARIENLLEISRVKK